MIARDVVMILLTCWVGASKALVSLSSGADLFGKLRAVFIWIVLTGFLAFIILAWKGCIPWLVA